MMIFNQFSELCGIEDHVKIGFRDFFSGFLNQLWIGLASINGEKVKLRTITMDDLPGLWRMIYGTEGLDERILTAVNKLAGNNVLKPILVGNEQEIKDKANGLNLTLDGVDIYDPHTYEGMEDLVQAFVERRKGKATEEQARQILLDENYFGTMLVYKGLADGLVSGAAHSTADTVHLRTI